MLMPEKMVLEKGKDQAMIDNKQALLDVVEDMEKDNLIMFHKSDGSIIMI